MKICTSCLIKKPLIDFANDTKSKDGKCYNCKVCISKRNKKYRDKRKQRGMSNISEVKDTFNEKEHQIALNMQEILTQSPHFNLLNIVSVETLDDCLKIELKSGLIGYLFPTFFLIDRQKENIDKEQSKQYIKAIFDYIREVE